jgi:hypothetical protein
MPASGKTTIDFGAFPGASDKTLTISGLTGITAGSRVEAWLIAEATADHSIDEHLTDGPMVMGGNPVAATSLTIYAKAPASVPVMDSYVGRGQLSGNNNHPLCYGLWTVGWAYDEA